MRGDGARPAALRGYGGSSYTQTMAEPFQIVEVAIDDIAAGDALAVTDEDDPRSAAFHVAHAELVHPMATGEYPRIALTSTQLDHDGKPLVLEYPPGTVVRKIV